MGKIQEILESHQAPGFISSASGHGAIKEIKNDRVREKVKEQLWKRRNRDERWNPENNLL